VPAATTTPTVTVLRTGDMIVIALLVGLGGVGLVMAMREGLRARAT